MLTALLETKRSKVCSLYLEMLKVLLKVSGMPITSHRPLVENRADGHSLVGTKELCPALNLARTRQVEGAFVLCQPHGGTWQWHFCPELTDSYGSPFLSLNQFRTLAPTLSGV